MCQAKIISFVLSPLSWAVVSYFKAMKEFRSEREQILQFHSIIMSQSSTKFTLLLKWFKLQNHNKTEFCCIGKQNMMGNQIMATLLINSYWPFSFLSLPLLFVLCVRLTRMGSKLSFFFFFSCSMCDEAPRVLGIQNASCQYFSCQLSFCSLLIRLIKRNNSLRFCVYSVFLGGLWVSGFF